MNQGKVSIIIAIYNSQQFLPMLFSSLEKQTYTDIEIVLVDDGSPDDSGRMCDEYAAKDKRVVVIHQENGGTCAARNAGLSAATGDWIMIVDGDDWLEPDCVEYLLNLAVSTGSEMALSTNLFTTRDRVQIEEDGQEVWSSEQATAALIYPYMKLGPWNKIYCAAVIRDNDISFSVPWFGEGLYFATQVSQRSNQVGVGHRKVYNYRLNNTGSGLTNYNVQNGRNAVNNIEFIGSHLIIDTPKVRRAVDWHLWRNYEFLLTQIIGCKRENELSEELHSCIVKIRKDWRSVFINSEVNLAERLKILCCGLFPVTFARLLIRRNSRALEKDKDRFMAPEENASNAA